MWKIQHKGRDFDWEDTPQVFLIFEDAWRVVTFLEARPYVGFQYRISKTFN